VACLGRDLPHLLSCYRRCCCCCCCCCCSMRPRLSQVTIFVALRFRILTALSCVPDTLDLIQHCFTFHIFHIEPHSRLTFFHTEHPFSNRAGLCSAGTGSLQRAERYCCPPPGASDSTPPPMKSCKEPRPATKCTHSTPRIQPSTSAKARSTIFRVGLKNPARLPS
jgi:hypothetical protein